MVKWFCDTQHLNSRLPNYKRAHERFINYPTVYVTILAINSESCLRVSCLVKLNV